MRTCRWCGVEGDWPRICMNTRDMEDVAIYAAGTERGDRCFRILEEHNIGEKGLLYVIANREAEERRAETP